MKPTVKIILYIGLFLLLIGVCLYGYISYEGFQSGPGSGTGSGSASFCDANENKCAAPCKNKTLEEKGPLAEETEDEKVIYDLYESYNLDGLREANENTPKTDVQKYDMAGELSEFDVGAPIPWDYDNRQMDPSEILWGTVHNDVSVRLFQKSYNRAVFGSGDPAKFIETTNDTGRNLYRSNVFQSTVYGPEAQLGMQAVEAVQDMYTEMVIEYVVENVFVNNRTRFYADVAQELDDSRPRIPFTNIKDPFKGPTISHKEAIARAFENRPLADRIRLVEESLSRADRINFPSEVNGVVYRNADGSLTQAGRQAVYRRRGIATKIGDSIKNGLSKVYKSLSAAASVIRLPAAAAPTVLALKGFGRRISRSPIGSAMRAVGRALAYVAPRFIMKAVGGFILKFMKFVMGFVPKLIVGQTVLASTCVSAIATATSVAVATAGVASPAVIAITAACAFAQTSFSFLMISIITWIPQLMSTLVDEEYSICDAKHPWNLKDAFYKSPGGEAGWEIFSAIPVVGDITYMIFPYLCWGTGSGEKPTNPGGPLIEAVLKQNVKPPYYYYDPTLSIYTEPKPFARVRDANYPTSATKIVSGVAEDDPKYTNHHLYTNEDDHYPFLVDFSHKIMLDMMAQYYYETSRANMYINPDGTGKFEYISKIYGIISSSELSCDMQCEITEITIDTMHGTKLCEKIVDVPYDAPAWYHDRRFYFHIDTRRGRSLDTAENRKCAEYLEYVQSPQRPNQPKPSCLDYDSGSDASRCSGSGAAATRTTADCIKTLGITSIYDSNGNINSDNIETATRMCNKILLHDTLYEGATRASWSPADRMADNMAKYYVTGCTFVDGTAPDSYDSKNQNVEGIQVGDTVTAVGPIGGTWYPPMFVPMNSDGSDGGVELVQEERPDIPKATDCSVVRSRMMRYGTTNRTDPGIDRQAAANLQAQVKLIVRSPKEQPWGQPILRKVADRQSTNVRFEVIPDMDISQLAKTSFVYWLDCPPGNSNCRAFGENAGAFWTNMAVGSVMGYIGSRVTYKGLPTGALFVAGTQYMGIPQILNCLAGDKANEEGTFVQNGFVVTSHQRTYILNHGPTIQFSPGYKPTIVPTLPPLQMRNCANRYTVRKFIDRFRKTYTNWEMDKIYHISPRRVTPTNPEACCVFGVSYTQGLVTAPDTLFKMKMNSVTLENVMTWQPDTEIYSYGIPKAEPLVLGSSEEPSIPTMLVDDIRPSTCERRINCNDLGLQQRLFKQFNASHLGVFIDYDMNNSDVCSIVSENGSGSGSGSESGSGSGSGCAELSDLMIKYKAYVAQESSEEVAVKAIKAASDATTEFLKASASTATFTATIALAITAWTAARTAVPLAATAATAANSANLGGAAAASTAWTTTIPPLIDAAYAAIGAVGNVANDATRAAASLAALTALNATNAAVSAAQSARGCLTDPSFVAWTPMPSSDGAKKCVYRVNFEKHSDIDLGTTGQPNIITRGQRRVTMTLKEIANPTEATKCLYDLDYDDYPDQVWYKPIPLLHFDVPPPNPIMNTNFQRGPNCYATADCSGTDIMNHLVTAFNKKHTNRKINAIYRSFTPVKEGSTLANTPPICDYDVEMIRSDDNIKTTLANQETVRFNLTPSATDECMYDLSTDDSNNTNSGLSLNRSQLSGMLKTAFTWSPNYLQNIRRTLNNYLLPVIGLDSVNQIKIASKTAKDTATVIFKDTSLIQKLSACPSVICSDPFILQKILNRYNFTNYPPYPGAEYVAEAQYGAQQRSIISFRRSGIASPSRCHVELIQRIDMFDDFLYSVDPEKSRTWLQLYKFDINGNDCGFTITPPDLDENNINISIDPYGIQSEASIVDTNLDGKMITSPLIGSSENMPTFTYRSPTVNCMDPTVLAKVRSIYEAINVASPTVIPRTTKYNKMVSVLEWFNPVPNVCEYKMNIQHNYFDTDYGYYYTVPATTTFSKNDESSYIVAQWAPDTDYDVETGILKQNKPTVTEYFYPDMDFRADQKFYRNTTSTTPLNLPYLSGEGLSGIDESKQPSRVKNVSYKF